MILATHELRAYGRTDLKFDDSICRRAVALQHFAAAFADADDGAAATRVTVAQGQEPRGA